MTTVRIFGENNPECPLCNKKFKRASHSDHGLVKDFFYCPIDAVAIQADDPMVGHWNNRKDLDSEEEIPCPKCGSRMNLFCRTDGYMKAVCENKKCKAEVETHDMPDGVVDMEE